MLRHIDIELVRYTELPEPRNAQQPMDVSAATSRNQGRRAMFCHSFRFDFMSVKMSIALHSGLVRKNTQLLVILRQRSRTVIRHIDISPPGPACRLRTRITEPSRTETWAAKREVVGREAALGRGEARCRKISGHRHILADEHSCRVLVKMLHPRHVEKV
jgi:hypothetical protein